jgi:heme exporter protein A
LIPYRRSDANRRPYRLELCCRRGDRWLFHGLDLRLEQGEALHLTGPNGAGKTSLMRMLAGLLRPSPACNRAMQQRRAPSRGKAPSPCRRTPRARPALPLGKALDFWRSIDGARDLPLARLGLDGLLDVPCAISPPGRRSAPLWPA